MSATSFLSAVGGVLGLLVAVAFTVAYLRTSVAKNTVELYRIDNEALRARVATLEAEDGRKSAQIAGLQSSVAVLREVVTQKEPIARLERFARAVAEREAIPYG